MSKLKFNFKKENSKRGVALLFAIVVSMILFTILAGVLNIALKETIFSMSVKNSNDAFYAADSGIECALYNDKTTSTIFAFNSTDGSISCLQRDITVLRSGSSDTYEFEFKTTNMIDQTCAKVVVKKVYDTTVDPSGDPVLLSTTITSRGYNKGGNIDTGTCDQANIKSVERVLEVRY